MTGDRRTGPPEALLDAGSYQQAARECDVIMKGGITSGVLYPLAVCELARVYRFRNVGGTSAGAIAAAAAAAAEVGRASTQSGAGFVGLAELPEWLGSDDHLAGLFRPPAQTRSLHRLLMKVVTPGASRVGLLASVVAGAVGSRRWWLPLLGAAPGGVLVAILLLTGADEPLAWVGVAVAALLLLLGLVVGSLVATALTAGESLEENMYGVVAGSSSYDGGDSLSDWLADQLDILAGRPVDGPALTFGDLWAGGVVSTAGAAGGPVVNLEMLTTNVTEGRPYRLPDDLGSGFRFDEEDFRKIFPGRVVDQLLAAAGDERGDDGLVPLPPPRDLPVVVATRMSLSFPLLVSAVPLYAVDHSLQEGEGKVAWEKAWFSDGGITSNFPISFFDALLPSRPTFGITLRGFHPKHPQSTNERENVWMPRTNTGGILEWWSRWPQGRGLVSVLKFLRAIADTMQNWVDNTQTRVPGYRDRVVHIAHADDEGGLNLAMPPKVLDRLSERGRCAGERLVAYYTTPPGEPLPVPELEELDQAEKAPRVVSWENHRWVRLRTSLALMSGAIESMAGRYDLGYRQDLARDLREAPSYRFANLDQQALARTFVERTTQLAEEVRTAGAAGPNVPLDVGAPRPAPVLRVAPGGRPSSRGLDGDEPPP